MSTELTTISPEGFDIANAYIEYGDVKVTAEQLQLPQHEVVRTLQIPAVKRYLDGVYLDMGYRNRSKLGNILDRMIESKIEEAEETGIYTKKDLLELLQMAHKMRMDEIKAANDLEVKSARASRPAAPAVAVQVNNNGFGDSNYGRLMDDLFNNGTIPEQAG